MLTRLKVSGFKNLVDVDVRFGAFTCIAGTNGVGKSNLFDAIHGIKGGAAQEYLSIPQDQIEDGLKTIE
jgi:AAA15 family ATPase/GTPase